MFRSTPASVLVSSLLFGSYHVYQGSGPVICLTLTGLLYGSAFAVTRRVWPVAIAHAAANIIGGW